MTDPKNYLIMLFIVTMVSFGTLIVYVTVMLIKELLTPKKLEKFEKAILATSMSEDELSNLSRGLFNLSEAAESFRSLKSELKKEKFGQQQTKTESSSQ